MQYGFTTHLLLLLRFYQQFRASPPTIMVKRIVVLISLLCAFFILTGCPQDPNNFQEEAIRLKKQTTKLESVIQSLQEGNKVLQQQIDRLNQDARATEDDYQAKLQEANNQIAELTSSPKKDLEKIQALEKKNAKLAADAKWLRTQRDKMRNSVVINQIGGKTHELPFEFTTVSTVMEDAFTKNGYTLLSSILTDQRGLYITDRKTSLPPSIELSGFRNQYIATIQKGPGNHTTIWVKAEFEKLSNKGHIFAAPQAELADIELRLIQEIHQTLTQRNAAHARRF